MSDVEKILGKRKICTKDSFQLAAKTANLLSKERITPDDVVDLMLKANDLGWETTDLRIAVKLLEEDQVDLAKKYIARQVGDFLMGLSTCMDALVLLEPKKIGELIETREKEGGETKEESASGESKQ